MNLDIHYVQIYNKNNISRKGNTSYYFKQRKLLVTYYVSCGCVSFVAFWRVMSCWKIYIQCLYDVMYCTCG